MKPFPKTFVLHNILKISHSEKQKGKFNLITYFCNLLTLNRQKEHITQLTRRQDNYDRKENRFQDTA